jgi:hypothetical protein
VGEPQDDICGATAKLPPEFIEIEKRIPGNDWTGVTVTCIAEPHGSDEWHWGLLILDGDEKGERYWSDPPPEPAR